MLLHGVGQGPTAWQPVVDVVGLSRPVLAPWLRGLRPGRQESFDLDAAVGSLAQTLQLNGWPRVALVGSSLGSVVAIRLAATQPELVERLLVAAPIVAPPRWALAAQRGVVALTPRRVFVARGITKDSVRAALAAVSTLDPRSDLDRLSVPVRIVVGANDAAGQHGAAEIERRVAGSSRHVVPGAGTDLLRDAGPELGRLVGDWVSGAVMDSGLDRGLDPGPGPGAAG